MTTCATCGRQIDGDFPFCPYCRAELTPAPPSREQRKRVTVLFCDVTGSTALGERTDPEALRALLARYFERMQGIIESHGGTVEKFIGDAVMAVFGVPVLHEDDALRAVRAAGEMQAAVGELGLQTRIGVTSGEVVTGTRERLATGDAVNVAARLEQAAAPGEVLLGEATLRLVKAAVQVEAMPALVLKGKSEPVPAYRLLGLTVPTERTFTQRMIGRERELDRLQDAYGQMAHDQSCQLFTILGAAGVGKSRLAGEFLGGVEHARMVRGRCLSYGEGITYWPVVEVIKQLDTLPSDAATATVLRTLFEASRLPASAEEIAWAFRTLLEEQARKTPLVVVFDDIHWGEETFLDLIEHVADLSRDAPLLLLCMARPELLEKRPGWGGGKWNATTVLLEPLDAGETDQLLDALTLGDALTQGVPGVEDGVRERIRTAAEGNPLFVEEMLALIKESGGAEVTVPPTVQALMAARLDQLAPTERSILECGAVEGRVFHRSAITTLLEDKTNVPGRLVRLVRKELVRPERAQVVGDDAYRFRHLLIRDAAYDAVPKAVRAELHKRFVSWLTERGADLMELDEIVGYHLEQAARYQQELGHADPIVAELAGERLGRAGRRALWRGDTRAAAGLLERALILVRPLRLDVDLELDFADAQPDLRKALAMTEAVAERARVAHDRRGEMVAGITAAYCRLGSATDGSIDELESLARQALPLLEDTEDHAGLVRMWRAVGQVAQGRGRFEEWTQAMEREMEAARHIGHPTVSYLPLALLTGPRPADAALQTLEAILPTSPGWMILVRAEMLAMLGRFEEAWATAHEASRRIREVTGGVEVTPTTLAHIAALTGDYDAAARYGSVSCDWLEEHGRLAELSTHAPELGRYLCVLGRYGEAERLAQRGRELGDEQDFWTQALWREVQALVCAHRGQHDTAETLAREAVAIAERTDALNFQGDVLCDLAEVVGRAGRPQEAKATLEEALERYERKKNLAMVAQIRQRLATAEEE